jgi:cytochrome c oxidase subunit 4
MADEDKKEAAKSDAPAPASKKAESGSSGSAAAPALAHAGGGHADHGHGLAHTMPISMLVGVLAALMALTVLTVSVTSFDLGAQGNLVIAMIIATVKAGLVVAFFMHLVWDKKLHLILFLTSVLFLILFLSLSVNDRGEYQPEIDAYTNSIAK